MMLGQNKSAIDDFDEAIRLNAELASAYQNRAGAKAELERYEEAIADLNQAIWLKPESATCLCQSW